MADILLATLNAKYIHAAFGLRYLMANLGELQPRAEVLEFDINQRPLDIVEALLARSPRIIGLGTYIWNVAPSTQIVAALKRLQPEIKVVVGGPEVSYESGEQEIVALADHVITGEADLAFASLCACLLRDEPPLNKIIPAPIPDLALLRLPYSLYNDEDIAHRVVYVEASRGCPFTCEFCLSSLDIPVRQFPLPALLAALEELLERGVTQFKFVDRTFNLNLAASSAILEFFLNRWRPGLFLHFEMIPDRFPDALRKLVALFPPGALQFEVGIQTFNPEVSQRISRRQDYARLRDNLGFLSSSTGVHVHADLILGLPGESLESMAEGFNQLLSLKPQEIQIGILKRLRGTPIQRHDLEWEMVYSPSPPYEILRTKTVDFPTMQRLRRFARFWDLVANSGNFVESLALLFAKPLSTDPALLPHESPASPSRHESPFWTFLHFSDWLYSKTGRQHGIALSRLAQFLFTYLTEHLGYNPGLAQQALIRDFQRTGRKDAPVLAETSPAPDQRTSPPTPPRSALKRQSRHATRNSTSIGTP